MEQITISIKGTEAGRVSARLMKAIYKTMAAMDGNRCHIDIHSETAQAEYEEIAVPEFMEHSRQKGTKLLGLTGKPGERRQAWTL